MSCPSVAIGHVFNFDAHTKLTSFGAMGPSDVILRLKDGGELQVHSEILQVYSSVLRDVSRSTLAGRASADEVTSSVLPLSDGDVQVWGQSLTALYFFVQGRSDQEIWRLILVRCHALRVRDDLLPPERVYGFIVCTQHQH